MPENLGDQQLEQAAQQEEQSNTQPAQVEAVQEQDLSEPMTAEVQTPEPAGAPKGTSKKKWILIAAGVIVIVAFIVAALLLHHGNKKSAVQTASSSPKKAAQTAQPTVAFEGKYLAKPQDLSDRPNLFKDYKSVFGTDCSGQPNTADIDSCPALVQPSDMIYKQIGTTNDGKAIIIVSNGQAAMDLRTYIALRTSTGEYSILGKYIYELSSTDQYQVQYEQQRIADFKKALDPSTTLDMDTEISDLLFPQSLTFRGTTFKSDQDPHFAGYPLFNGLSDLRSIQLGGKTDVSKVTKLGYDGPRTIYQVVAQDATNYSVKEVYETVSAVYATVYKLDDGIASADKAPTLHWSDGGTTQDAYADRAAGCGSGTGYIVAKNVSSSDLKPIGTGPAGQTLYAMPTDSPLFQQIYKEDYGNGDGLDASLQHLSADQLQGRHAIFVVRNGLGEYVVYKNENYFQSGGCAKPVVYLYPTKSELVNVSVGAKVTKSAPVYSEKGWRNVLARSNGQLSYQGQTYDSLYWEGLGLGSYPLVTNGTVVAAKDAVPTIQSQLAAQGLNQKEVDDFVAYWRPYLPKDNFVRLSWFGTAAMNELAPLNISPKPDTTIRVFLDFQALDHPVSMPAPHFSAPKRTGFTVVEWGGLDRSGSVLK